MHIKDRIENLMSEPIPELELTTEEMDDLRELLPLDSATTMQELDAFTSHLIGGALDDKDRSAPAPSVKSRFPTIRKSKHVTMRIPESLIAVYKAEAAKCGMGYQTLMIRTLKRGAKVASNKNQVDPA